jgi:peptide/nickel transport system permease protein
MRHWFRTIWSTRGLARWILVAGLFIVVVFVVFAILAPWVAPYEFNQSKVDGTKLPKLAHPSGDHWLGTNDQF